MTDTSREALIAKLRYAHTRRFVSGLSIFSNAADMLEADAQEVRRLEQCRIDEAETTNKAAQASRDLLTKALNAAQQVAVPVPVAGLYHKDGVRRASFGPPDAADIKNGWRPLYLHPAPPAQQVAVPVPLSDAIASMRSEMEMAEPLSDVYLDLLERLQSAIVEDISASFALGNMPVYATGNGNHVAVHPSAQNPEMFQVSRYALDGIIGDSQYLKIIDLVLSEGLASYSKLDEAAAALVIGSAVEAEGKFETRKAQSVPKQKPLGWMIEGSSIVAKGDFAELDTKAEAKRIGGTCKAYPIYREPVLVEQEPVATVQCINGITIGYLDVMQPVGTKLYAAPVDIEALTKERDALMIKNNELGDVYMRVCGTLDKTSKERDALTAAAKMALNALCRINDAPLHLDHGERLSLAKAITALRQAGVQ